MPEGDTVYRAGDTESDKIYILSKGTVTMYKLPAKEQKLAKTDETDPKSMMEPEEFQDLAKRSMTDLSAKPVTEPHVLLGEVMKYRSIRLKHASPA